MGALVERFAPLIWSICRTYRLDGADADDVGQTVWLYLLSQLGKVRDPAALPGWLATTTRRECVRVLRAARGPDAARTVLDAENAADEQAMTAEQELLAAERRMAAREAFMDLPPCCQRLIAVLIEDPPVPYAEISARPPAVSPSPPAAPKAAAPTGPPGRCARKKPARPAPQMAPAPDKGTPTTPGPCRVVNLPLRRH